MEQQQGQSEMLRNYKQKMGIYTFHGKNLKKNNKITVIQKQMLMDRTKMHAMSDVSGHLCNIIIKHMNGGDCL